MKQFKIEKQVMAVLFGLGLFGTLTPGVVFADDTAAPLVGTEISSAAMPIVKEVKITNSVTGVKGMILSIGIRRASDGKWFDMPVNKDISTGEIPGSATIEQLHLTEGRYNKLRVGHQPLEAKGLITITDAYGNQTVYGSMPRNHHGILKFKKGQEPAYFDLYIPDTQIEKSKEYEENFMKEGAGSFIDNGIQYDTTGENIEVVKDDDGKLVIKDNQPLVFLLRTNYIWAGAGVSGIKAEKIPGLYDDEFDDSFVTAKIEKLPHTITMGKGMDPDQTEYAYRIPNVINNSPDKARQTTEDTYFFNEDFSIVQAPRIDPIEIAGSRDEYVKYLLAKAKQQQSVGQFDVVTEKTSDEVVYRQRVI